jgi:aspartyl/glutamyl-tRNA(Asn/Gln) amidotransferase C subunit
MKIDLNKLSKLANLPSSQNNQILKDLEEISNHFDVLQNINTDSIDPLYQVNGLKNVYRQDIVSSQKTLIKDGYFTTKAVINKNG